MENTLTNLIPNNYSSFIGSIVLIFAFICFFITFNKDYKVHATKIFAMLMIIVLALFSSHWATYFASIFIIATAVTELEFLQNLAAIIRKDEHYFKYKQETLSKEDNIKRKVEESVEDELILDNKDIDSKEEKNTTIDVNSFKQMSHSHFIRYSLEIEEKALNYLSKTYGQIEHGVRITKNGKRVEFDGLINENKKSIIFEVKWLRDERIAHNYARHFLRRFNEMISKYIEMTGKSVETNLVFVTTESKIPEERIKDILGETNLIVLSLEELGYNVIPLNKEKSE